MEINALRDRKETIRQAHPAGHVRQRIADAAEQLNLAGRLAERVELVNEALCKLTTLLYLPDSDGRAANVDSVTFRLLVPAPWGSRGWRRWGLRAHEAETLRCVLLDRQRSHRVGARSPLFTYDVDTRSWYLNVGDYPRVDAALLWLRHSAITLAEWRRAGVEYRQRRITVQSRYNHRRRNGVIKP